MPAYDRQHTDSSQRSIARRQVLHGALVVSATAAFAALSAACGGSSSETTPTGQAGAASSGGASSAGTKTTGAPSAARPMTASSSAKATKVTIAQGIDIATFDPHEDTSSGGRAVFENVFDNLVARDQNLKIVPSLAESWQAIDPTTWEFKLRKDVKFHDGTPFTAKDIKFSFDHVLDPNVKSRQRSNIAQIDHAEAPDDYTLRIVTKGPLPPLFDELQYVYALPADKYQSMGAEKFAVAPIGTGPFKFVEWVKDSHVMLERFDGHWRGKASINTAEFRPISEDSTRVAALQAGEIDLAALIPPTSIPTLQSDSKLDVRSVRSLRTVFVGMNTFQIPFTDVRVRQALNYAVDVASIIKNVLGGHGYQLASVSGPSEFGYNPDVKPYAYDLDKAKSLLKDAGYADGFSTTLDTPQGRYLDDVEVSQAIAGQLAKVGVKVDVKPAEFNEYFNRWLAKKIQGLYFLGAGGSLDADSIMGSHFDSKRRGLYYNSPKSDDLIHQAQAELDVQKREQLYHDLMVYLHDQAPWIFLYSQEDIYGVAKTLTWKPIPDERLWVYEMSQA